MNRDSSQRSCVVWRRGQIGINEIFHNLLEFRPRINKFRQKTDAEGPVDKFLD